MCALVVCRVGKENGRWRDRGLLRAGMRVHRGGERDGAMKDSRRHKWGMFGGFYDGLAEGKANHKQSGLLISQLLYTYRVTSFPPYIFMIFYTGVEWVALVTFYSPYFTQLLRGRRKAALMISPTMHS